MSICLDSTFHEKQRLHAKIFARMKSLYKVVCIYLSWLQIYHVIHLRQPIAKVCARYLDLLLFILFLFILVNIFQPERPLNFPSSPKMAEPTHRDGCYISSNHTHRRVRLIMETVNYNERFTWFLVANLLTDVVNIYLKPEERSDAENMFILMVYMFLTTTAVFILYKFKLRPA